LRVASPEAELLMRLEKLRREIDARARASVLWFILALVIAFGVGVAVGRFFWRRPSQRRGAGWRGAVSGCGACLRFAILSAMS
jgi:hypothetical protein